MFLAAEGEMKRFVEEQRCSSPDTRAAEGLTSYSAGGTARLKGRTVKVATFFYPFFFECWSRAFG